MPRWQDDQAKKCFSFFLSQKYNLEWKVIAAHSNNKTITVKIQTSHCQFFKHKHQQQIVYLHLSFFFINIQNVWSDFFTIGIWSLIASIFLFLFGMLCIWKVYLRERDRNSSTFVVLKLTIDNKDLIFSFFLTNF